MRSRLWIWAGLLALSLCGGGIALRVLFAPKEDRTAHPVAKAEGRRSEPARPGENATQVFTASLADLRGMIAGVREGAVDAYDLVPALQQMHWRLFDAPERGPLMEAIVAVAADVREDRLLRICCALLAGGFVESAARDGLEALTADKDSLVRFFAVCAWSMNPMREGSADRSGEWDPFNAPPEANAKENRWFWLGTIQKLATFYDLPWALGVRIMSEPDLGNVDLLLWCVSAGLLQGRVRENFLELALGARDIGNPDGRAQLRGDTMTVLAGPTMVVPEDLRGKYRELALNPGEPDSIRWAGYAYFPRNERLQLLRDMLRSGTSPSSHWVALRGFAIEDPGAFRDPLFLEKFQEHWTFVRAQTDYERIEQTLGHLLTDNVGPKLDWVCRVALEDSDPKVRQAALRNVAAGMPRGEPLERKLAVLERGVEDVDAKVRSEIGWHYAKFVLRNYESLPDSLRPVHKQHALDVLRSLDSDDVDPMFRDALRNCREAMERKS